MENLFYNSIIDFIQLQVDALSKEWDSDRCKPIFTISIGRNDKNDSDIILLTITHMSSSFTEIVFPRSDSFYGYDSIGRMMKQMYNRTM